LVNLAGEVIGINSAIKSRSGGFQGVGLTIASNMARGIVQQLQNDGVVKRPYLGIEMASEVSPEVAQRFGLKPGQGVVITGVTEKSPAAKAGIKPDDAITAINGQSVTDNHSLVVAVGKLPIGQQVSVDVLRNGEAKKLPLTLELTPDGYGKRQLAQPNLQLPRDGEKVSVSQYGLELADLSAEQAKEFTFVHRKRHPVQRAQRAVALFNLPYLDCFQCREGAAAPSKGSRPSTP